MLIFSQKCIFLQKIRLYVYVGFPGGASGKESTCNTGDIRDTSSIPGSRRGPQGGMATQSSILAWRIPWTEEPGRLSSMGLQRVGHNWSNLAHIYVHMYTYVDNKKFTTSPIWYPFLTFPIYFLSYLWVLCVLRG